MKEKWYLFDRTKGSRQKRPPVKKWVVVLRKREASESIEIDAKKLVSNSPESIAIGYMKNAAGDKQSPYFVIPGLGGEVIAWCDCLPEDFDYPRHLIVKDGDADSSGITDT